MGVNIGGREITDLRYADDTALLSDNSTSMRRMLHRVNQAGKAAGLKLNAKKTKIMHITNNNNRNKEVFRIDNANIVNVNNFKYLGSFKEHDGNCTKDIKTRIGMAKNKMVHLNNIWKDHGIETNLKLQLLKCLIWPVMLYGCEAWTKKKADSKRIEAAEMWFYRRLLRVKWTEKRTN